MPEEKYQLKPGVTIFYDDETNLKVIGNQVVELDPELVTGKTAVAVNKGALIKVKESLEPDRSAMQPLPSDIPGRNVFTKLNMTLENVKALDEHALTEIDGITAKTAKEVIAYLAKNK